jgi:3-oxosteroid 1-dehydrogenase
VIGTDIPDETDVVVVGSGAASLVCAIVAAVGGLRLIVVEKSEKLGGTSAMSGRSVWVPANLHGRAALARAGMASIAAQSASKTPT